MSALFILAFSSFALLRFAVLQWRAIWITAAGQPLAEALQAATGIDEETVGSQDFGTLIGLYHKLSPGLPKTSSWLREVSIYYRFVASFEQACRFKLPSFSTWAKREMQICSRYAAVVLGQSLSMQLDRQLAHRS